MDLTIPLRSKRHVDVCTVDWCDRPARTAGLCSSHYVRKWKGQDMDTPFRTTLPKGKAATRDEQGRKQCRDCERWLPESAFSKHPRTTDGLRAHCRACNVTARTLYMYGLTAEDYRRLFHAQGNRCAICTTDDPGKWWCIDHDHACCPQSKTCGKCVRGIICDPCNNGLGRFGDSPERLRAAADYLERHAAQ